MARTTKKESPAAEARPRKRSRRAKPTEAEIRVRAYELFVRRGSTPGHEVEDWLQAEAELLE